MIEDAPLAERRLLAKVDILEGLLQAEVDYVATHSAIIRLGKVESFVPGEDSRRIILLLSGRVRVHEPGAGRQDLTFSVVEEGTVVGHTGFAPRRSRALGVEALEPSVLSVVDTRRPDVGMFGPAVRVSQPKEECACRKEWKEA
jgi:CRP-like cAMP-binding protein